MTSQALSAAPGWYPDGHGAIRYFDGSGWTEHTHQPATPVAAAAEPAAASERHVVPFYRTGWFIVDVAVLAFIAFIIIYAAST